MHDVNRRSLHFTFMPGNSVWSVGRLARKTGLSRQRIWQLARGGWIPAKRLPGKQHRFHESPALIAWIKQKARQSAWRRKGGDPLAPRRVSRRRAEKIEKLREILENQTEVSAEDKEAALLYYGYLFTLWLVRWLNITQRRIPLLEGIHALYESKLIFGHGRKMDHSGLQSAIERLPTCSETTPQTEQSSLNVSARSQTKPQRRARRQARDNC
jgi:hypothetical protein